MTQEHVRELSELTNTYRQALSEIVQSDPAQRDHAVRRAMNCAVEIADFVAFDLQPQVYLLTPAGRRAVQECQRERD